MLARYLSSENWIEVYQAPVSMEYNFFHNTFQHYFDVSCPKVWIVKKQVYKNTWIKEDLKNQIKILWN